jgi:hypothetical protein
MQVERDADQGATYPLGGWKGVCQLLDKNKKWWAWTSVARESSWRLVANREHTRSSSAIGSKVAIFAPRSTVVSEENRS